jgi:hypothetical protein
MRGLVTGSTGDVFFEIDTRAAESNASNAYVGLSPTGFFLETTAAGLNASGGTYIYIAIRRGPMKTPTAGTEVFEPKTWTGTGANASPTGGNFPPDLVFVCRIGILLLIEVRTIGFVALVCLFLI